MYNFLKHILGFPPSHDQEPRPNNAFNGNSENWSGENNLADEDFMRNFDSGFGNFSFPIFSDPVEIHKYFDSIFDEMQKKFSMFGFKDQPSIFWEGERNNFYSPDNNYEEPIYNSQSLRDSYLKMPKDVKGDSDLDGKVKPEDVNNILNNKSEISFDSNSNLYFYTPKMYSKSVIIKTVVHPDGSVETIKTVTDNSGNKETTITQNNINDSSKPPSEHLLIDNDDASGISVFKKFFPF